MKEEREFVGSDVVITILFHNKSIAIGSFTVILYSRFKIRNYTD